MLGGYSHAVGHIIKFSCRYFGDVNLGGARRPEKERIKFTRTAKYIFWIENMLIDGEGINSLLKFFFAGEETKTYRVVIDNEIQAHN
ncbi:MAG TPA: hypothetical protein PLB14_02035, partial [Smithellaceae bacterium]|nr:hypothetical protein [Smithellaceae bacterium]